MTDAALPRSLGTTEAPNLRGRRRKMLIQPRYQLGVALRATALTAVFLALLNAGLHVSRLQARDLLVGATPELGAVVQAQDTAEQILVLIASVALLCAVFLLAIRESHRTAGAAFHLRRHLARMRDGEYRTLRLRDGDNLRDVEGALNELALVLQDRTWSDIETLEELAAVAYPSNPDVAQALNHLAQRKRGDIALFV